MHHSPPKLILAHIYAHEVHSGPCRHANIISELLKETSPCSKQLHRQQHLIGVRESNMGCEVIACVPGTLPLKFCRLFPSTSTDTPDAGSFLISFSSFCGKHQAVLQSIVSKSYQSPNHNPPRPNNTHRILPHTIPDHNVAPKCKFLL